MIVGNETVTSKITWEWLGGFSDGEASFTFLYVDKRLVSGLEIPQKRRPILERIREFLKEKAGAEGTLYYARDKKQWRLRYAALEDAYRVAHAIYPYLNREHQKERAIRFMEAIRKHTLRVWKLHGPYWMQARKLYKLTEELPIPR